MVKSLSASDTQDLLLSQLFGQITLVSSSLNFLISKIESIILHISFVQLLEEL